jgi:hypothetical protein
MALAQDYVQWKAFLVLAILNQRLSKFNNGI